MPGDGGRAIRRFAASYSPPGRFSTARAVLSLVLSVVVMAAISLMSVPASRGSAAVPGAAPAAASQSNAIVAAAQGQLGLPYCFAGGDIYGPTIGHDTACTGNTVGFDCSGLALYAVYQATGILLPHYSINAVHECERLRRCPVSRAQLLPGDLVFFTGAGGPSPGHVGVYIGNGQMIDAQQDGVPVAIHPLQSDYVGAVRYWSGAATTAPTLPSDSTVHVVKSSSGLSCTGYYSDTVPPATIRVLLYAVHTRAGRGSIPIGIVTVPFRDYVRNVVPSEWAPWWLPASLQAGALAVKTRGWYWVNHFGGYLDTPDNCFDVTDDTQFQRYIPGNTTTATDAAVNATWPVLALQGGAIFPANFRADLSTVGEGCGVAVDGTTLSQWGTQACATQGMSAVQMMTRYYRHVFTGSPQASGGAVYDAQGGYHVFTRGPDGTLRHAWSGTAGWDEEKHGTVMIGAPAVSYANGRYDVFVIGVDGATYHRSSTTNGWSAWKRISTVPLAGGESVVRDPAGNFHVFGTDWLGALWQISGRDDRWSAQSLGGLVLGTPAVTYANGRFDIFAVGVNQTLYQRSYFNGHWTAWTQIVNRPFRAQLNATVDAQRELPPLCPRRRRHVVAGVWSRQVVDRTEPAAQGAVRRGRDIPSWPLRRVHSRPRWFGRSDDIPGSRLAHTLLDARTRTLGSARPLPGSRVGQGGSIRKTATFPAPFSNASGVGASTTPVLRKKDTPRGTSVGNARMIGPRSDSGSSTSRTFSVRRPCRSTASPFARAFATQSPFAKPPIT